MENLLKIICRIIRFVWNIVKHVLLLPLYCSLPDKYNGITYDEWLKGENKKD